MRFILAFVALVSLSTCNQNGSRSIAQAQQGSGQERTNTKYTDNTAGNSDETGPSAEAFKVSQDAYFSQVDAYSDLDPRRYTVLFFVAKDQDNLAAGSDTYISYGDDLSLAVEESGFDETAISEGGEIPEIDFPDYKMWSTTDGVKYGTLKLLDKDSRGVSASKLYTAFFVKDEKIHFLRQLGRQKGPNGYTEHNWEQLAEATAISATEGTIMYGFKQDRAADDLELITLQRNGVWTQKFDQASYLEDGTIQFSAPTKLSSEEFNQTDMTTLFQRQGKQNLNNDILIMSAHPDDVKLADEMLAAESEEGAGLHLSGIPDKDSGGSAKCRFYVQVLLTVAVMSVVFRSIGVKFFRKKALRHPYVTNGALAGAGAGVFVGFAAASTTAEKDSDDISALNILGQVSSLLCTAEFWYGLGDVLKTVTNEVVAPLLGSERRIFLDSETGGREDDAIFAPEPTP